MINKKFGHNLNSPWCAEAKAAAEKREKKIKPDDASGGSKAKTDQGTLMRDFSSAGTLSVATHILNELGFIVGDIIKNQNDKTLFQIVAVDGSEIHVTNDTGNAERIALSSFQNKEWSIEVKKPTPAMMPRYPPVENAAFMAMAIKGEISQHLFELATSYRVDELSVMSKPTKAVTATIKFPKGKLVLVPSTLKIEMGPKLPSSLHVELKLYAQSELHFWLAPYTYAPDELADKTKGFVAPFWFVGSTDDQSTVNMELTSVSASCKIPLLKNICAIPAGTTLLIHRPADDDKPAKKIRTG